MIVALLVLIVCILLFGAGVVKGWLKGVAALGCGGLIALFALGFVVQRCSAVEDEPVSVSRGDAERMVLRDGKTNLEARLPPEAKPVFNGLRVHWMSPSTPVLCGQVTWKDALGKVHENEPFYSTLQDDTLLRGSATEAEWPQLWKRYCG